MKPRLWHTPYKSFLSIIFSILCLSSFNLNALNWYIVTSEADAGSGTLRDAIETINAGGSDEPNAIAFANNVQTITLQSNLPVITPTNDDLVIDGLAIANLADPDSTVEGDCSLLPSPVSNAQEFSENIRVTIDGSGIPSNIDSDDRWGLNINQAATIRGLRIQNISAPGNGSRAVGIVFSGGSVSKLVECCEITQVQNSAYTTNNNGNRAVGIEDETTNGSTTVSKCYIHDIEGGSIASCDNTEEALESGAAYGLLQIKIVDNTRIECITSGSISSLCSQINGPIVGRSIGIAWINDSRDTPPNWPCPRTAPIKAGVDNCPIACDQTCLFNTICIQDSHISNIYSGSVVTDSTEVFLVEVAGILIGTPFGTLESNNNVLIQNNTVDSVANGSITSSGNQSTTIVLGSFGIVVSNFGTEVTINCNTIKNIQSGSMIFSGELSNLFPGYYYGIWNLNSNGIISSIQCNQISHVCGPTATLIGECGTIKGDIASVCNEEFARHTPGGQECANNLLPLVAGILQNTAGTTNTTVNNNTVESINGGTHVAQGEKSSVSTPGTIGIYVNASTVQSNQNNISSVIGTELIAKPGSLSVIKQEGTTGLCIISPRVTTTDNRIELVCEGRIVAAHNSLGANLTNIFFGLAEESRTSLTKHLEQDDALPYAPVITSGITVSAPQFTPYLNRSCGSNEPWCITDNTIKTVIGSAVTGGIQPLGSIATGLWLQPSITLQNKNMRSFESCATARQNDRSSGVAFNNRIQHIIGGTNAPAYGIFLDGSAHFFDPNVANEERESLFFTLDQNSITTVRGSKDLPVFEANLSALLGFCPGSVLEEKTAFPFLPFDPPSGIYTLFGGCSTLSNNTITEIKAFGTDARGITTAASSDMLITGNTCSKINGYGIFVGGVIATIDVAGELGTDPSDLTLESFASVRNKIHTNSTFDNTNKGIKLGLVDWSNTLFGIENLNVCPTPVGFFSRSHQESVLEDTVAIFGNHGQPEPCITKVICNSNGTVTIEIDLKNTHPLTDFIVQFFRNNTETSSQGEQAISQFNDTAFVFTTDFNGRAQKRFTFIPLATIQNGDSITAHATVNDHGQAAITSTYFCDTSEFGGQASETICNPKILSRPHAKPLGASGFAAILNR